MTELAASSEPQAHRYEFDRIDLDSGSVHADVVDLVGTGGRVLELGPATGYMSRVFVERGCEVVGIEIDPGMAEQAAKACERVIVGDLDGLDLEAELGDDRFDAIVAADVLEHLKDPLSALERLKPFLKPEGSFVISVPNVAHGSVRLALLGGSFEYREIGLLDSTHLHFFTRQSFERMLDEAELGLGVLHRHDLNLDASEVPYDADAVPAELLAEIEADADARTYQFVVKVFPLAREGLREIQSRLRRLAELEGQAVELERRNSELESALAGIGGRESELRRAFIEANDQLLVRDGELGRAREEIQSRDEGLRKAHAEVVRLNEELVAARLGLERIRASAPFRAYSALKAAPGLKALRRRRESGFAAEMARRTDGSP